MLPGSLPIRPRKSETPIVPIDRWVETVDGLFKTYRFREPDMRDEFIRSLLGYEHKTQHRANVRFQEGEVTVNVVTKDAMRVTEIDKEYARFLDVVFRDIVSRPRFEDDNI